MNFNTEQNFYKYTILPDGTRETEYLFSGYYIDENTCGSVIASNSYGITYININNEHTIYKNWLFDKIPKNIIPIVLKAIKDNNVKQLQILAYTYEITDYSPCCSTDLIFLTKFKEYYEQDIEKNRK